jgi:hypothetical protein
LRPGAGGRPAAVVVSIEEWERRTGRVGNLAEFLADRLAAGRRRSSLDDWLHSDLPARFAVRLLGIDAATADAWGRLIARGERAGKPMSAMDGWIAAVAKVHGLVLVTRNHADFAGTVARVVNPWAVE